MDFSKQNYWLNIDKPTGITSAHAVAIVKRLTGAKKVGHGGTLDPFADGVLPIAVNKATKTAEKMMAARKKYRFTIKWGEFRDSDDIEGKVEETSDARPKTDDLEKALKSFVGKISQSPSKFSAIKINGKRAYELARNNVEFSIKPREIEIFALHLLSNNEELCEIEVECSKGTYVRSLSRDICNKVGVCGFVSKLTRLAVGDFKYENKISLEKLKEAINLGEIVFCDGSLLLLQDAA